MNTFDLCGVDGDTLQMEQAASKSTGRDRRVRWKATATYCGYTMTGTVGFVRAKNTGRDERNNSRTLESLPIRGLFTAEPVQFRPQVNSFGHQDARAAILTMMGIVVICGVIAMIL